MAYQKKSYGSAPTAPLEKELIVVELSAEGQYGPYVKANGEFYGLNEPLTHEEFTKGEAYTILVKRGKPSEKNPQGKKYIAQIVSAGGEETTPAPTRSPAKAAAPTPAKEAKADYAAKE